MALLGSPNTIAGYLGGIAYKEMLGSYTIDANEDGITVTRKFHISWSSVWAFIAAMTPTATQKLMDTNLTNVAWQLPDFPGRIDSTTDLYRSRMIVKSINVVPAHGGKTPGIKTSTTYTGLVEYDEAEVTVEYGLDIADKRSTEWQIVANEKSERGAFKFSDSNPADVSLLIPMQEFSIKLSGWKIGHEDNNSIRSTNAAIQCTGKVNTGNMTVYNGTTRYTFLRAQVRLDSYEIVPRLWFGQLKHDLIYHFRVCPGLYGGQAFETDQIYTNVSWQHVYDPSEDFNEFRLVTPTPYEEADFDNLMPTGMWAGNADPNNSDITYGAS